MFQRTSDSRHYPFELPSGWVWTTLGEIGKWQAGGTPNRTIKSYYGGEIPWLKTGDLNDGIIENIPESITEEALQNSSAKLNPTNSILIAMYGATIGKLGILSYPAATNQACCACIEYSAVEKYYLFYFLLSHRHHFIYKGGGGAQPNISKEKILNTAIPLPPIEEQRRIIKAIEKWFLIINIVEANKNEALECIKVAKNKILDLAIHGKLVPQHPADEPAIKLLKRVNPSAEITCDNEHYPHLPENWVLCKLEDIVDYEQPTLYIVSSTEYKDTFATPVLTAGKSFIIGHTNETNGIYSNLPCIIFDDFTTDSKYVDFPFKVKSSAMKILKVKDEILPKYVAMFMSITRLVGKTHKRYWISEYSKIQIPIPPKEEQQRIISSVEKLNNLLGNITESL